MENKNKKEKKKEEEIVIKEIGAREENWIVIRRIIKERKLNYLRLMETIKFVTLKSRVIR